MINMIRKVKIPENIEVVIEGKSIIVRGLKGEIKRDFSNPRFNKKLSIEKKENEIIVTSKEDNRPMKSMVGTICANLNNMFIGVSKGYKYTLKVYFVHFPVSIETKQEGEYTEILIKNFLGERKPRRLKVKNVKVEVSGDLIILRGIDKEAVGQIAGRLESITKIRQRDRRVFNDGIFLVKREIGE